MRVVSVDVPPFHLPKLAGAAKEESLKSERRPDMKRPLVAINNLQDAAQLLRLSDGGEVLLRHRCKRTAEV